MIELMLGVILIMLVLAGSLQFIDIASMHSAIDAHVRGDAGVVAMSPLTYWDTPACIKTWTPGPDGPYTAGDQIVPGTPNTLNTIANYSVRVPTDWNEFDQLRTPSSLVPLHLTLTSPEGLGFIGVRIAQDVPVSDIIQELVYPKPTVTVREDVWFPVTKGLY